ncbi:unnamed protein product [Rotaria sordida]|uniref:F-box domain-containing protein n=1 Tax=Rotaria sordida TaxID=392033 RepID=A0A814NGY4_9BILA|nr:unnamed protein product [Rotaria sordida]CAF1287747.1 unnamed protein product [Rotaria sordida]
MSKETITYLEDLSNEIFYEIFDFLDFLYIYEAFSNLNIRFQNLISSILSIKMKLSSISKSTFQCYYTQIIIPYQYKIKSLHLTNPFINEILFSSNSIELKFIRLETLILDKITYEYLGKLLNHLISFPYLSSLVIICVDFVPNQNIFYCQIFRLPILKYCNLSWRRIDSNRWKRLILSYMPHLRIFDFLFYTSSYSNNDIKEYVAQIDKFNSPFWFEREWFFKYHIENKEYR